MKHFLNPTQAALSLGVSESSLKRWCDRGWLEMQLTAGGHRKVSVAPVVKLVIQERREIVRPERLGISASYRANSGKLQNITSSQNDAIDCDCENCPITIRFAPSTSPLHNAIASCSAVPAQV